jgi:hypothetical protein
MRNLTSVGVEILGSAWLMIPTTFFSGVTAIDFMDGSPWKLSWTWNIYARQAAKHAKFSDSYFSGILGRHCGLYLRLCRTALHALDIFGSVNDAKEQIKRRLSPFFGEKFARTAQTFNHGRTRRVL